MFFCFVDFSYLTDSGIFFFQAEDGIRDYKVTGVQTCALPICSPQAEGKLRRTSDSSVVPLSTTDCVARGSASPRGCVFRFVCSVCNNYSAQPLFCGKPSKNGHLFWETKLLNPTESLWATLWEKAALQTF